MRERASFFVCSAQRIPNQGITSVTDKQTNEPALSDDVLWGCAVIAAEIARPEHITFRLLQRGLIPADKVGAIWVTTRTRLRAHFNGTGERVETDAVVAQGVPPRPKKKVAS
jgi:hypothetical protein